MKIYHNSPDSPVEENVKDVVKYGNPHQWVLVCKASSQEEGWMKSTKAFNLPAGCLIQVTTQQGDEVAEAITFVPGGIFENGKFTN